MDHASPGAGRGYRGDLGAFRVGLGFTSARSLTYDDPGADDRRVGSETAAVTIEPITDGIVPITWRGADETTVVHVEGYRRRTIVANITGTDLSFSQFCGTFRELA